MDEMVLKTQKYLNSMYGGNPSYNKVTENGKTGWTTIYALTRAFQIELGITNTADSFGPTTEKYFCSKYPNGVVQQSQNDRTTSRVYAIIQGALWCKGYSTGASSITEHFYGGTGSAIIKLKKDAGLSNPNSTVTLNVMKALLSMNQYVTLYNSGGSDIIRSIQQNYNAKYEKYVGLMPCDGLYGREMNKALIKVLQAIEGLSVSDATGNFGNMTKGNLPILPDTAGNLSEKTKKEAIYLLRSCLCCNGYDVSLGSDWDGDLTSVLQAFQSEIMIQPTGIANIDTWMALLLSKGNPDRSSVACDTRFEITDERAKILKNKGYSIVGRYLTGTEFKVLRKDEPKRILDNGLSFFPIFQESGSELGYFTSERGEFDAVKAVQAARSFGIPKGTVIYFAVDLDATDNQIELFILPYFRALSENIDSDYKVGIYGTRNVCTQVCNKEYAVTCFVSDMSTGYSGNMGYRMPKNWTYDQYAEITIGDGSWGIDKDAFSGKYPPVSSINTKPYKLPERYVLDDSKIAATITEVIGKIKELEYLYIKWYESVGTTAEIDILHENPTIVATGVTNFLRSVAYSDFKWTALLLKGIEERFVEYVKSNNLSLYNYLYNLIKDDEHLVSDGKGGYIDLKHVAASTEGHLNAILGLGNWSGWAGDLATGARDVSNYIKENNVTIQEAADYIIGNMAYGTCTYVDLCADFDAIKLADIIYNSTNTEEPLSEALKEYYISKSYNRSQVFVEHINCNPVIDKIAKTVIGIMTKGTMELVIMTLLEKDIPDLEILSACCLSFSNYVFFQL